MDTLGPVVLAFIVLLYYGLRLVFQPLLKRKGSPEESYFFNEDENPEGPETTLYDETQQSFPFNDPLEESSPPPTRKYRASTETEPSRHSTPPPKAKGIFSQLQEELSNLVLKPTDEPLASTSMSSPSTDTPSESSRTPTGYDTPPLKTPPSPSSSHPYTPNISRSTHSTPSGQAQPTASTRQTLKMRLNSPHKKKEFLRQMIIMNEIIDKPLALRKPSETMKHL